MRAQSADAHPQAQLLRRALTANAVFSLLCALVLGFGAPQLAPFMGLPTQGGSTALRLVAAGLAPFALWVGMNARRGVPRLGDAWVTSIGDGVWVLGSALLLLVRPDWVNAQGQLCVLGVAAVVGSCGLGQALGAHRLGHAQLEGA